MLKNFFKEIDQLWGPTGKEPYVLSLIGSTALFLQCNYSRGTKDSDILEIGSDTTIILPLLLKIAGKGTTIAKKYGLYLESVGSAFPFLPRQPLFHEETTLSQELVHFKLKVLDVVDVVVSKLKSFRAQDVDDIRHVIELELVDHQRLVERFQSAIDSWSMDARASDFPQYIENLHTIERDLLLVPESKIETPRWIYES